MVPLKNSVDPSFVNLMPAEITSDDSVIQHHYQHPNVFGAAWLGADGCAASVTGSYGLHFANRPCPPSHFLCLPVEHSDDRTYYTAAE